MRFKRIFTLGGALALTACLSFPCAAAETAKTGGTNMVEKGKKLVTIGGCNDCHTPKVYGPKGADLDAARLLSGQPADAKLPPLPSGIIGPGKWAAVTNEHFTAWFGPWGVSFSRNLTPDMETGLGSWTEEMFIKAMRTGKHMGAADGRDILPPMPWQGIGQLPDEDLKAIWAYLHSLKPVKNAVPEPIPPQQPPAQ